MAKQIVVLHTTKGPGGDTNVSFLMWLAVAAGHEIAISGATSQWTGASTAEHTAIASGSVSEEAYAIQYPSSMTKAQIEADVLSHFNARQVQVTAQMNPNQFYGVYYDPALAGWSA